MPFKKVNEEMPEFRGWHLCRIGGKDGYRLPLMITRVDLIVGADGKCYKPEEVEWLDEFESTEPNQEEELWNELSLQLHPLNLTGEGREKIVMDWLKSKYTLSRK